MNEYINIKNRGGVNMDKLNINDFPSLDGVSLIPTKTLQYIINIYIIMKLKKKCINLKMMRKGKHIL